MRRYRNVVLLLTLTLVTLSCRSKFSFHGSEGRYVTTLPVFAAITGPIVGEANAVHVLLGSTTSPHDYLPRPADVRRILDSRILVLGHPDLDGWADSFGASTTIYLSELIEAGESMSSTDLGSPYTAENPHFWMDPLIVSELVKPLAVRLCGVLEEECNLFKDNARAFADSLELLTTTIKEITTPVRGQVYITVDPSFDYFLNRFGLISAASLESLDGAGPTPASLVSALRTASSSGAVAIVTEYNRSDDVAAMFAVESGLPIIYLDPLGSPGVTYSRTMLNIARAFLDSGLAKE